MEVLSANEIEVFTYTVAYLVKNGWTHNCYAVNPIWNKFGIKKTERDIENYGYKYPLDHDWYNDFTLQEAYDRQMEEDDKQESLESRIDQLEKDVRNLKERFNIKGRNTTGSPYTLTRFKK